MTRAPSLTAFPLTEVRTMLLSPSPRISFEPFTALPVAELE